MWRVAVVVAAVALLPAGASAEAPPETPILTAMAAELERSMRVLADAPDPPYFLSYEVTERHNVVVRGAFGTAQASTDSRTRQLDIDLRVGDPELDNTRQIRGQFGRFDRGEGYSYVAMPLDDDADAIRAVLWYQTDRRYKSARERLTRVRTNVQVAVEQEDRSADFSPEEAISLIEEPFELSIDTASWEAKVRRYSAPFARHGEIYSGSASLVASVETRWYVNSEGSRVRVTSPSYRLVLSGQTKADDGMDLPRYESFFSRSLDGLPDDATVLATAERMASDLLALREAPVVDPYTGPAILSGRASGVFFHEVFGHRIEGHRLKNESDGQTFKKLLDEPVLPDSISVYFDPTENAIGETDLAGSYRVDNEGVSARRVPVIEDGVFRRFLMSRSPIDGFSSSNGHGRREPGYSAVSRQSNLLVEVAEPITSEALKSRLLDEVERQGKPYGLRFEDIQGGFTHTGRTRPNAFNVLPILVYRVFPDGTEELVRGVDLVGTPLTAFGKVVTGDDRPQVFNGTCGAESGGVPVSAVSPALLISEIEVQKKAKSQDRPPILPAPLGVPAEAGAEISP